MYEQRLPIEEWKAKKQAELKETIAAQKSVLQEVVQDGQRLADYLYGRGGVGRPNTSPQLTGGSHTTGKAAPCAQNPAASAGRIDRQRLG